MTIELTAGQFSILGSVRDGDTPLFWTPELIHYEEDVQALCRQGYLTRQRQRLALTAHGRAALAEMIEIRDRPTCTTAASIQRADVGSSGTGEDSHAP